MKVMMIISCILILLLSCFGGDIIFEDFYGGYESQIITRQLDKGEFFLVKHLSLFLMII